MSRRIGLGRLAAACTLAAAVCRPAAAQFAATLDAAGGSARIDRSPGSSIALFAPAMSWRGAGLRLDATGVYSGAGARGWNAAGFTTLGARSPRFGAFEAEFAGRFRWTAHAVASGTSVAAAELGLRMSPARWTTLSLAGGLGSARARGRNRPQSVVRLTGRALLRGLRVELGLERTSFSDRGPGSWLGADTLATVRDSLTPGRRSVVEYTDASLGVSWQGGRHELSVGIGRRLGNSALQSTSWSLSATRWLTPQLALVAGAGHYVADPVASLPSGRYATIGLRIGVGGGPVVAPKETPTGAARGAVRASRGIDGLVALLIDAPGAHSVEVMGDFTDWRQLELERADAAHWRARLPISPGIHHLLVRIDGGKWQVPPGAQSQVDEFGVPVGALLVN